MKAFCDSCTVAVQRRTYRPWELSGWCAALCAAVVVGWASSALACGGGFGQGLDLKPEQTIAIGYHAGVETYVFRPGFCGPARSFGLVLPIPGALQGELTVAPVELFSALAKLSAPEVVYQDVCYNRGGFDAGAAPLDGGTQVVGGGRVDIFEWVALTSSSGSDLTAWLDQNGYPYDSYAAAVFADYVAAGSQFIAFKVAADTIARDAGGASTLCGTFGPISLRFASAAPVVPVHMAASHVGAQQRQFVWDVYIATTARMKAVSNEVHTELRYAGTLGADSLAASPELALIAQPGDHLTELMVSFRGAEVSKDLTFSADDSNDDFRRKLTYYRNVCESENDTESHGDNGCSVSNLGARPGFARAPEGGLTNTPFWRGRATSAALLAPGWGLGLVALLAVRRRRRRLDRAPTRDGHP